MKNLIRLFEEDATAYLARVVNSTEDAQGAVRALSAVGRIGLDNANLLPAVRWVADEYKTNRNLDACVKDVIEVVDRLGKNAELKDLDLDTIQKEYPTLEDVKAVLDAQSETGMKMGKNETFDQWTERMGEVHRDILKKVLPSYEVMETLPKYNREVQTYVYGSVLGIGVLSTNTTGESFMYFVERSRVPMGYSTCSSWLKRFNLVLAIRDAYRMTMLALRRGVFRRCNRAQYRMGTGKIRRTEN